MIINKVTVFETGSSETWSSAMFVQRFLKEAGDEPIKSCRVPMLNTTTEVANEFFTALNQREMSQTGIDSFFIEDFRGMETPLEESILEDLSDKLSQVRDFRVYEMRKLPEEVRSQIVQFASMVIEQNKSNMSKILFVKLSDKSTVTASDERLALALSVSN